jgi:hypothetical protein
MYSLFDFMKNKKIIKKKINFAQKFSGILLGSLSIYLLVIIIGLSTANADVNSLSRRPALEISTVECDHDLEARVHLVWNTVPSAKTYQISRNGPSGAGWKLIENNLSDVSYVDYYLSEGFGAYQYQIKAAAANGATSYSDIVEAIVPDCKNNSSNPTSPIANPVPMPAQDSIIPDGVPGNLIANSSFEITDADGDPQGWNRGGWGSNDRSYSYPTAGRQGGKAAKVAMTQSASGDVKWYFESVNVNAGQSYTFEHWYRSDTSTQLVALFSSQNGDQYHLIEALGPASTWTTNSATIDVPSGITSMTVFHLLAKPGFLEIDDTSLIEISNTTDSPTAPSAPDQNDDALTPAEPIPAPVQEPTPEPLPKTEQNEAPEGGSSQNSIIANPSLEIPGGNGDPIDWMRGGWGTNNRTFTYPIAGIEGADAARVDISQYTNGDAKWYFKDVTVDGGETLDFQHWYKASAPTTLVARYATTANYIYVQLAGLPVANNWTKTKTTFDVPDGAKSMTIFHILSSAGSLSVDAYNLSRVNGGTAPSPVPQPAPNEPSAGQADGKYVMLNAISWGERPMQDLPMQDISEATYFVLPVDASGNFIGGNADLESKLVKDAHTAGKKATLSIAGGAQKIADIELATVTNKSRLIQNIVNRLSQFGYDGVILDIENTNLPSSAMPEFILALRAALGTKPSIGVYVQPWQKDTVWWRLQDVSDAVTWVAPMIYDFDYTLDELKALTLEWLPKVGGDRSKLLAGVAVNYETGLSPSEYKSVLEWVSAQGLGGVGVWQNKIFTQPWIDAQREVWPVIK